MRFIAPAPSAEIEREALDLLALNPSAEQMAEMERALTTTVNGIRRESRGWNVHPMMREAVHEHGAELVLMRAHRSLAVIYRANVMLEGGA